MPRHRQTEPANEPPDFYIREHSHTSVCSVNYYWFISIRFEEYRIQRRLNKAVYDYDEAIEIVEDIIRRHGKPLKQTNRKVSNTCSSKVKQMRKQSAD